MTRHHWIVLTCCSYTMNLAQATRMVLEELGLTSKDGTPNNKPLPWRQSLGLNRREEDVRPIFWKNRNKSYIARTQDWDEFPNGRWGDSRSPAFGELDAYGIGLKGTNEQNIKLWGSPQTLRDLANIFIRFLENDLQSLPWSESPITSETDSIKSELIDLNRRGLLTITSQPSVNGVKSSHPIHGWGPHGGYVYQKAYLELLIPPQLISELIARIDKGSDMTFHAVNKEGDLRTNAPSEGPNAVTWGVFPGKEIVQPTIVETISFLAWKDEAFKLGFDWAKCHSALSPTRTLIEGIIENWYLINIGTLIYLHPLINCAIRFSSLTIIVHNDFHSTHGIFRLFDGLEVKNRNDPAAVAAPVINGISANGKAELNGSFKTDETVFDEFNK